MRFNDGLVVQDLLWPAGLDRRRRRQCCSTMLL
jgi:hypothetical protein